MNIRQLRPNDAKQFREMRLKAISEVPIAFGPSLEEETSLPIEAFERRLEPGKIGGVFGAFENNQLIGIVSMRAESDSKRSHICQVFGLYVLPEYRNRGVARELLNWVIKSGQNTTSLKSLRVFVNSGNAALELLRTIGFQEFGLETEAMQLNGIFYDAHHLGYSLC